MGSHTFEDWTLRVYPVDAQMTPKRGKNKEVRHKRGRVAWLMFLFWLRFDVLCALLQYTRTAKWNIFVLYIVLILVVPHKIRNVFKNLPTDDLYVENCAAHNIYVFRASVI